jgi:hypothetical protein
MLRIIKEKGIFNFRLKYFNGTDIFVEESLTSTAITGFQHFYGSGKFAVGIIDDNNPPAIYKG